MRKFLFLAVVFSFMLTANVFAATDGFGATGLTGGTTGKLDAIDITLDGIDDGDTCVVKSAGVVYEYYYDDDNATAEASPDYIAPDKDNGGAYAGDGRWVLNGFYPATLQLPDGTSINEFSTDGVMTGNSDDAVPTEQAVVEYIPQIIPTLIPGAVIIRTKATYSDTDTITLTPGVYHHSGTAEQIVYWDATLTFDFGSGGSNASSDDLTASAWHYLYIDDSALSGTAITAARLRNETTAPAWDDTDHAIMSGHDKCIGAFLTNGSSQIIEFFQSGDFILFADDITSLSTTDIDTTWTDVTLSMPGFSTMGEVMIQATYASAGAANALWRTNGQTGTVGHLAAVATADVIFTMNTVTVITDTSQKIEVKNSASDANQIAVYTNGFYLPTGM